MIQPLSVEVVIMRCGAPVHIEVAVWRTRLELEQPLLRVLLHQGEDLHKEDGGRLWKKMVIDEHHVENALLILHKGEDLHMDDGDGGGDANGHNVLLFLRKWTRFKWIEGKTKDKIDEFQFHQIWLQMIGWKTF